MKLTLTSDTGVVLQEWESNTCNWPLFSAVAKFTDGLVEKTMEIDYFDQFSKWEKNHLAGKTQELLLPKKED